MTIRDSERGEIERLSHEKKTQREIAREVGVSVDSVRAVERSLGLQRQPDQRGPLTEREMKKIARLYKKGFPLYQIAKRLHLASYNPVSKAIKRMGLSRQRTLPEARILEMVRARISQRQIARALKIPYRAVFKFCRSHGFARPRFHPSAKQLVTIIDLTFAGCDSAASIAKKLALPYYPVLKLVHRIRKCSRFLPAATLSSYLPMKHRDQIVPRACEEESMMMLLDCARRACFDCHVAPDPRRLVAVSIAAACALYLREKPEARIGDREQQKIVSALTPRFLSACDTLLSAEQSVVH